ncbi:MAG: hypothetical protein NTU97_01405 [Candidatus Magasanikbacteria bacterium]|nr:hypothetical protein [Candidatus Magasanikbacteria bacterium]
MKRLLLLVPFILSCSIPLAEGWNLKVDSGRYSGEVVTWGLVPRPVDQDTLTMLKDIYAADRREIAFRRANVRDESYPASCGKGERLVYQRDDYTEYFTDTTRQNLVYRGCGPDAGETEYWRTLCLKEDVAEQLVEDKCYRFSAPDIFHCRFGHLAYARSVGPICLERQEILTETRGTCDGEVGMIQMGADWLITCLKIRNSSIRPLVHVAGFIDR